MPGNHERENSWGGFQYRWNYDEYQKNLQRRRKKSASRGMCAFCLTTAFVFLLCTASLLVVLCASYVRSADTPLPPTLSENEYKESLNDPNPPPPSRPADTTDGTGNTDSPSGTDEYPPEHTTTDSNPGEGGSEDDTADTSGRPDTPGTDPSLPDQDMTTGALTVHQIAQNGSPSTVTIQCKNETHMSVGSGFFISSDGYLVTNHHVIRRYDAYKVILSDGTEYDAVLVASDPTRDIAILSIDAVQTPHVTVSTESPLIGDQVVAIGTPGSIDFAGTVTYGYVSGLDRTVEISDAEENAIGQMNMIQITAVINPGNSGGPLFNRYGEVIGINTMKLTGEGYEGMGFSIPIADVIESITEWIDGHRAQNRPAPPEEEDTSASDSSDAPSDTPTDVPVTRPWAPFGVCGETVTAEESVLYQIPVGVIIRYIEPDSYAEKSGLRIGDIILAVNGIAMLSLDALDTWTQGVCVGDTAELRIFRAGKEVMHTVQFGEMPLTEEAAPLPAS